MALQILVGGQDYTSLIEPQNFKVTNTIATSNDTAELTVKITQQAKPRPKGGQEIQIINGSTKEFGGVILQPTENIKTPDTMLYDVQCQDYHFWLNKKCVTNTYTGWTAGNIVKDIISRFTGGFTTNNVQGLDSSFTIPILKFDYVTVSSALDQLAKAVGFSWWVDYNKDVHFGPMETIPSPLPGNILLPDNYDPSANLSVCSDLKITEDVSQLRNQIYLKGYKVPADYTYTDVRVADGQTATFNLTYEPKHNLSDITVTVGGVAQAKKIDVSGGLPNSSMQDNTAYIYYQNQTCRFNVPPASGTIVAITYYPMFELVSMFNDPSSFTIMKQRDLQDGVYEYPIRDRQLTATDNSLAATRGQMELYKYGYPRYTGQFRSFLQGWQAGQYYYMTSNARMDGIFQNQLFYVIKVDKTLVNHPAGGVPLLQYTVYFCDIPYVF